jgi:putative membrane protein
MLTVILSSLAGAVLASLASCIPGLHVYQVMGALAAALAAAGIGATDLPPQVLAPFAAGLIAAYALVSTVPSVLLAAPDESAMFTVLPGQKFLMAGRGYEGVMLTAAGGLAGLFLLVLLAPLAPRLLPTAQASLAPHLHWIVWCVIAFMLLSEWPKGGRFGPGGWRKFADGWRSPGMGLLTFALSGFLGFVLLYRSPVSVDAAFQNIMPAFVGLFTLPWLVMNLLSRMDAPPQRLNVGAIPGDTLLKGVAAGALGGGFAAFFPVITGGVGGMLAGHATALRDDRAFLISQGVCRAVYYAGGFLLFFVPGLHATRGGGASLLRTWYEPQTVPEYWMALAALALSGSLAFLLTSPLARATLMLVRKFGYRRLSWGALALVLTSVAAMTGWAGLFVAGVAACIGLLPLLYGARRMNCLGVILLPMACSMSGFGPAVATVLRLL